MRQGRNIQPEHRIRRKATYETDLLTVRQTRLDELVLRQYEEGAKIRVIANIVKHSPATVNRILKQHSVNRMRCRRFANQERTCKYCGNRLTDENWLQCYQKSGYYVCRDCLHKRIKDRKLAEPEKYQKLERKHYFKSEYGISLEEYDLLLQKQHGLCKICKKRFSNKQQTHLDHNHRTAQIRGILCHKCNLLLGLADDDIHLLRECIAYLEETAQ